MLLKPFERKIIKEIKKAVTLLRKASAFGNKISEVVTF